MGKHVSKALILALIGGASYVLMELAFRGKSHWTMFIMGGVLFLMIGAINEYIPWETSLLMQGCAGSIMVTYSELLVGLVLNIWLGMGIWDYSDLPFNFLGQICLPFSVLWIFLSILAVIADDLCRWKLFGEEMPHYTVV